MEGGGYECHYRPHLMNGMAVWGTGPCKVDSGKLCILSLYLGPDTTRKLSNYLRQNW